MAPPPSTLEGPHKAAILMVLLGHEVAGKLLNELPPDMAAKIVAEVARLGSIEHDEAERVLEDYFVDALRPEQHRGGAEAAQLMLEASDLPPEVRSTALGGLTDPTERLLAPLLEAPAEVLSAVLAKEHVQTAALVLLNLTPRKAGQVLAGLPDDKRSAVVNRMTCLGRVRGEILEEVVVGLEDVLRDPACLDAGDDASEGLERTAQILQAMARGDVRELLDAIEQADPEKAAELRKLVFTFDSLMLADDRGIQELLRVIETKTLAVALSGAEPELRERFMSNLSERAAGMLQEEMEFLGTVKPADLETAQREITEKAIELEQEEKLVFSDPDDGGEAG